ncbi:MAG TPA: cell division protein [Psychromonas hadalis]|nr:cell division protein [Psychromonas hadalis]
MANAPKRRKSPTVTKKNSATAKKRTRKRPVKAKKSSGSGLVFAIIAVLAIVAGIGYMIFSSDAKVKDTKRYLPKERAVEALPEKPEPNWSYETNLKTKEVVVDIPEKKKSTREYQMQCGSFKRETDAQSLKAKIAFQGLNSQVKKTGSWYRVILGPYKRKRTAEKERHKLQRAKINGCQVWLWR